MIDGSVLIPWIVCGGLVLFVLVFLAVEHWKSRGGRWRK